MSDFARLEFIGREEVQNRLARVPQVSEAGAALALNRTATFAKQQGIARILEAKLFPKSYLQQRIETSRASTSNLRATLTARARETLQSRFPNRQLYTKGKTVARKKAGIESQVKVAGGPKILPGAFYVRLRAGKVAGAGALAIAIRLPGARRAYEVLRTTSVHHAFKDVLPQVADQAAANLESQLRIELDKALAR